MGNKISITNDKNFDIFWSEYPYRHSKGTARRAWKKLKMTTELFSKIISAVRKQKRWINWTKENGKYIPLPATWLNGERWLDEVREYTPPGNPACMICGKPSAGAYCGKWHCGNPVCKKVVRGW